MAVINIPFGGQTVGIEIPDFAMETTQRDIFDLARDQLEALRSIETELTGQTSTLRTLASRSNGPGPGGDPGPGPGPGGDNDETRRSSTQRLLNGFKAFQGAFEEQRLSEMSSGLLSAVGFGGAAAAVGTVIGIIEKFGEAVSKTVRVGVGLGETMEDLKNESASIGVTFDQFAAIIATNGEMLRTLGDNTGAGAVAAVQLTRQFQELTQAQGHYGMANDEMMQLLLEEAEMRRQTIGQQRVAEMGLNGLAQSVADNIAQNTALARITGQDVRERMAARRAMEQNVIAQSFLTGQTDEARAKLGRFAETLAGMPGGNEISEAMINAIATGTDFRRFNPELFARMEGPAQELFEFIQSQMTSGGSMEDFDVQLLSLTSGLANSAAGQEEILRLQASMGNASAETLLAMQNQIRNLGSAEEIRDAYRANMRAVEEGGELAAAGINAATQRLSTAINNLATQFVLELMPGETSSAGRLLVDGINGLANIINEGNSELQLLFDALGVKLKNAPINFLPAGTELGTGTGEFPSATGEAGVGTVGGGAGDTTADGGSRNDTPDPTEASFTPDDFRNAVIQAFMEVMANGGLPVDVRNWGQMPRPAPFSSA